LVFAALVAVVPGCVVGPDGDAASGGGPRPEGGADPWGDDDTGEEDGGFRPDDDDSAAGDDLDGDGWTVAAGDCDDSDESVFPGAIEECDGVDNDCDGSPGINEVDDDADGFMICEGDCDDADASIVGWQVEDSGFMRSECNPVIDEGSGEWDSGTLYAGAVVWNGSEYIMYYSARGDEYQIGAATSTDLLNWTRYASNPVLERGAANEFDRRGVYWPEVVFDGSTYHMYYPGTQSGGCGCYQVGYAESADGYSFTRHPDNPVILHGGPGEFDEADLRAVSVAEYGGLFHMWYGGERSGDGALHIGHATSTDWSSWTKDPDNPYIFPELPDEDGQVYSPDVFEVDGQLFMVVTIDAGSDARHRVLTTTDRLHWTRTTSEAFFAPPATGWDRQLSMMGRALVVGDGVYLFYTGGDNANWDKRIGVAYNRIPSVVVASPADGAVYTQGDVVTFEAVATDHAFVENLEVYIESDLQGVIEQAFPTASGDVSVQTANLAPGEHTITLTVVDEGGLEVRESLSISVQAWDCLTDPSGAPDNDANGFTVCEGDCDDLDPAVGGWDRSTSGWVRSECNPVITEAPEGSFADERVQPGQPIWDGEVYRMWFSGYDGADWRIGYAQSADGVHWALEQSGTPVRSWPSVSLDHGEWLEWDDDGAYDLTPVDDGSGDLQLFYSGKDGTHWRTGVCTSSDWVGAERVLSTPVLDLGGSGAFDEHHAYTPAVLFDGTTYHMWYGGQETAHGTSRIGYADSVDGINWARVTASPVMEPTGGLWDDYHVSNPSVVLVDGTYLMAYEGHTGLYSELGLAWSSDGINWVKSGRNPLPLGAAGTWDGVHNLEPSLLWDGVDLHLWYTGCSESRCAGADIGYMINRWPEVSILSPADGASFAAGTAVTFSAVASDHAALDTVDVEWTDSQGTVLDTAPAGAQGNITFTTSSLPLGTHDITLTVTDEGGLFAEDTIEVVLY